MTVPGVNLICAATFIAAVGDVSRFFTSRKLVAYLGLDPKVRQSGEGPARSGRISKRGSASARWALVEAAWSVVLQPGPLHAFYDRTRARRGHGKAIVATAVLSDEVCGVGVTDRPARAREDTPHVQRDRWRAVVEDAVRGAQAQAPRTAAEAVG
jgi:hypothetical protein